MLEMELGRRYERLLFASAPISALALFVLLIAYAVTAVGPQGVARCYERYSDALNARKDSLAPHWQRAQPVTKESFWGSGYRLELTYAAIELHSSECYGLLKEEIDKRARASPDAVVTKLRADASELRKQPLQFSGIQVPSSTKIDVFGNALSVDTTTLAEGLQVVLAPLLLLWLGSLYTTRYRETLRISRTRSISEVFPHIINMYPVGRLREPRRRAWAAYFAPWIIATFYSLTRLALLSVFTVPPLAAYATSVWLLSDLDSAPPWLGLAFVLAMFVLSIILLECMPWHAMKTYRNDISRPGTDA